MTKEEAILQASETTAQLKGKRILYRPINRTYHFHRADAHPKNNNPLLDEGYHVLVALIWDDPLNQSPIKQSLTVPLSYFKEPDFKVLAK